jgi:hypothetical protein
MSDTPERMTPEDYEELRAEAAGGGVVQLGADWVQLALTEIDALRGERDDARALAVRLEQELANERQAAYRLLLASARGPLFAAGGGVPVDVGPPPPGPLWSVIRVLVENWTVSTEGGQPYGAIDMEVKASPEGVRELVRVLEATDNRLHFVGIGPTPEEGPDGGTEAR